MFNIFKPSDPVAKIKKLLNKIIVHKKKRDGVIDRFHINRKAMEPALDVYPWNRDSLGPLIEEKKKLLLHKDVRKEAKTLIELLKFILKLMERQEFRYELSKNGIAHADMKKAVEVDIEWAKDIIDLSRKTRDRLILINEAVIPAQNRKNLLEELKIADRFQLELCEHLDKLEHSIEEKIISCERHNPPARKRQIGMWGTAAAYTVAFMLAFNAVTATFPSGVGLGVKRAEAGEVQEYKSVDEILDQIPKDKRIDVNHTNYWDIVSNSKKAVVFFYLNSNFNGFSGNLARVFANVIPKFNDVILICYDLESENKPGKFYVEAFDIKGSPSFQMVNDGKINFSRGGSPELDDIDRWITIMERAVREKANGTQKK